MGNFGIRYNDLLRYTRHQIAAVYCIIIRWRIDIGKGRAYVNLNHFGCALTNKHVVLAAHIIHYIQGKLITRYAYRLVANNAGQRYYCNFGSSAANINNHVTIRLFYINSNTYSSRHRLVYHFHILSAGLFRRIFYRTFFNLCNTRWDTDNHFIARWKQRFFSAVNHAYHFAYHTFGGSKIGYYSVL